MTRKTNEPLVIYAVMDEDKKVHSFYRTEQNALDFIKNNDLSDSTILTITAAAEAIPPDEPEYQLEDKPLSDFL